MMIPSWISDGSEIPDPLGHGERAVQWLRKLKHPKNPAPGHPFQLMEWQERIVRKLYGPRNEDGSRQVRRVVLLLPRGNRKTSLCAGITLLHLAGPERIPGGLVISAASAREQAVELYNEAKLVVDHDRRLRNHLSIRDYVSEISYPDMQTRYRAISSDGKIAHGKTPNVVIADELHVWEGRPGRKQWEALDSALVKVADTLMIVATTAGRGQDNLAFETVEYAMKVQRGEIDDPATLPVIFALEEDDDWQDEDVWHSLNPGMANGFPNLAAFRDKAAKAKVSPPDRDAFLQYNLNRWLDHSSSPFVEMSVYDEGAKPVDRSSLKGKPCWLGVDLSATSDLTAIVAAFRDDDENYIVLPIFFCPADNLRRKAERDGVPYPRWAEEGFIIPTPGNVIDYRAVEQAIRDLAEEFEVREIAFDPHMAQQIMGNLVDDGFPVVEFRQGWISMVPAVKEMERAILSGKFLHAGHPVLRWNFSNIVVETDKAGNRMFHKGKSTDRIDGAVASAMAVMRASEGDSGLSIYESDAWSDDLAFF